MIAYAKIYYIVFGLLTIAGGAMGYATKGSKASLIAGAISGVLLIVAAFLIHDYHKAGLVSGLLISLLLAGKFIPDFLHKKAWVPGGMMSVLSIVSIVLTLLALAKI